MRAISLQIQPTWMWDICQSGSGHSERNADIQAMAGSDPNTSSCYPFLKSAREDPGWLGTLFLAPSVSEVDVAPSQPHPPFPARAPTLQFPSRLRRKVMSKGGAKPKVPGRRSIGPCNCLGARGPAQSSAQRFTRA
jgi:hypothetical protein